MKKLILFLLAFILVIYSCGAIKEAVNKEIDKQKMGTLKTAQISKLTGIEFVWIKGGEFQMGSDSGVYSSRPKHKVSVSGFHMAKYEITQQQYQDIMGKNPSKFKGANNPVERVSWQKANEFCEKVNKKFNVKIRLPYEAEWEYACQAGSATKYYWGDKMDGNHCWYSGNSAKKTHPVGKRQPNRWGLYDMSGNVWEWCLDWYDEKYYSKTPLANPKGPATGNKKVLRGGSYRNIAQSYSRGASMINPWDDIYGNDGFRVVSPE